LAAFSQKHRTGLVTLVFTDIVESTKLKQTLGDHAGAAIIQQHRALVRELLRQFPESEEIETAGDSFLLVFSKPSDAVTFGLLLVHRQNKLAEGTGHTLRLRLGIHLGEVVIEEPVEVCEVREVGQAAAPDDEGATGVQVLFSGGPGSKSEIRNPKVEVKLTDFGIGQVISDEYLKGVTRAGFTQMMLGSPSRPGVATPSGLSECPVLKGSF
jgi:hypothetical protein